MSDLLFSIFGGFHWVVALLISVAGMIAIAMGLMVHRFWYQHQKRKNYEEINGTNPSSPT